MALAQSRIPRRIEIDEGDSEGEWKVVGRRLNA
jgi:hypothetical protein